MPMFEDPPVMSAKQTQDAFMLSRKDVRLPVSWRLYFWLKRRHDRKVTEQRYRERLLGITSYSPLRQSLLQRWLSRRLNAEASKALRTLMRADGLEYLHRAERIADSYVGDFPRYGVSVQEMLDSEAEALASSEAAYDRIVEHEREMGRYE